jgi:maleylacetate reductase
MAEDGIRALVSALPAIIDDPISREARREALYGAWLCGSCLGATTMSLHHKLCHNLGGILNRPHAQTHTVVLPHALAFNQSYAPDAAASVARALGRVEDAALELARLSRAWGAPTSLDELGMAREDIPRVVEASLANPYANPREVTEDGLTALLTAAWAGDEPSAH